MRNYNNEEEIKVHVVIPWLESLGYKKDCMEFEKTIKVQEGRKSKSIFADIVIYSDKKLETPIIVVDTKGPKEILSKSGRDQVISYARLLPKIAPIAVLTNGTNNHIYQTLDKSRLKELPKRTSLLKDFVSAVLSKNIQEVLREEATKELFTIDDVNIFKDLLKKCHTTIRNNEGYDSIQAFDEMSKVLFAKMYEEQFNKDSNRFTLEIFDKTLEQLKVNIVQQQFQEIQKADGFKELFPAETIIELKDRTIREIVRIFERFDLTLTNFDVKGEAFEYFLGDTFTGGLGEYFTPRNVVEFIVEAISPKIGEKIIDPFCGTGGFLIYAFEIVSEKIRLNEFSDEEKKKWKKVLSDESLFGTDWKYRTAQACKMNMIVHGDGNTGVHQADGFKNIDGLIEEGKYDICFTNPPFGAKETDDNVLNKFELGSGRNSQTREILAVERCLNLVKKGTGVVAIILPDGILNGDRNSYVRDFLHKEAELLGVVGFNKETFEGYNTAVKTSVLFLKRKENQNETLPKQVFMAVCTNTGYSTLGHQIPGNQLPDILFDFKNFLKKEKFEPIHKNTKLVSLNSISDRIDAERYIDYMELPEIEDVNKLKKDSVSKFEFINQVGTNIIESITQNNFSKNYKPESFEYYKFSDLFEPVSNMKSLVDDNKYVQLGLHGKGRGLFKREENFGYQIGASRLNFVEKGWLVYSRLFAKNGSFGVVYDEFENGTVSNEFPTFKLFNPLFDEEMLLEYIVFYLISPQSINYIIRLTTGSTKESRGRFKEDQLMELEIPVPKTKRVFEQICKPIIERRNYLKKINQVVDSLDDISMALQLSLPNLGE
jgi:type I restriction enzyme M protein